jgi:hypothetical protein
MNAPMIITNCLPLVFHFFGFIFSFAMDTRVRDRIRKRRDGDGDVMMPLPMHNPGINPPRINTRAPNKAGACWTDGWCIAWRLEATEKVKGFHEAWRNLLVKFCSYRETL